ncbi:hypothetical protein [Bacillus cereus group sp. BfR-BA-01354]|uniref:hypothetical protein n=1 Tax=Bacillus cereus group sp. BfR-BA-01354 TaxID=2920317 RepID=UPI001F594D44
MDIENVEWEIQFAWDKQANLLNAQSRAFAEFRNLIKQFDELAHVDDKRRLELEKMRAETQFVEERINLIKGTKKDRRLMDALIDVVKIRSGKTTADSFKMDYFYIKSRDKNDLVTAYNQEQAFRMFIDSDGLGFSHIFGDNGEIRHDEHGDHLYIYILPMEKRRFIERVQNA